METGRPQKLTEAHVEDIQNRLNRGEQKKYIATCYGCSPKTVGRFTQRHGLRRDNSHLNCTRENERLLQRLARQYAGRHHYILMDQNFKDADMQELESRFNAKIADVLRAFVPGYLRQGQEKEADIGTYFFKACEREAQDYRQELADALSKQGYTSDYEITITPAKYSSYCFDCKVEWSWSWFPQTVRRGECPYCGSRKGKRLRTRE